VGRDGLPGAARDLVATPFEEANAALSPDGRLVAYESDEVDAINGIYVLPFADPGAKVRAPVIGPRWPRGGSKGQLYYWHPTGARPGESKVGGGLHRIDWREEASRLTVAQTVPLWGEARREPAPVGRLTVAPYASYDVDVSGPGVQFLFLETSTTTGEVPRQRPVVVLNWLEALRARADPRR
jgi:hypothetical protein